MARMVLVTLTSIAIVLSVVGCDSTDPTDTSGGDGSGDDAADTGTADDAEVTNACESYCTHIASCHPQPGDPDYDDGYDEHDEPPFIETCMSICAWMDEVYMPTVECQAARLEWYECMIATPCTTHELDQDETCQAQRDAESVACPGLE